MQFVYPEMKSVGLNQNSLVPKITFFRNKKKPGKGFVGFLILIWVYLELSVKTRMTHWNIVIWFWFWRKSLLSGVNNCRPVCFERNWLQDRIHYWKSNQTVSQITHFLYFRNTIYASFDSNTDYCTWMEIYERL